MVYEQRNKKKGKKMENNENAVTKNVRETVVNPAEKMSSVKDKVFEKTGPVKDKITDKATEISQAAEKKGKDIGQKVENLSHQAVLTAKNAWQGLKEGIS